MPINHLEGNIASLEEQAKLIKSSYKDTTDLIGASVDSIMGTFSGETVRDIYERRLELIRQEARRNLESLSKEIMSGGIDIESKQKIIELQKRTSFLVGAALDEVTIGNRIINTDFSQAGKNALYGIKGEFLGTFHGIISALDFLIFFWNYTLSLIGINPEYKNEISKHLAGLYDELKKGGITTISSKVVEYTKKEIDRISQLPQEQQAEAIGNIAGNVIAMLTVIKTGTVITNKLTKVSGQISRGENLITQGAEVGTQRAKRIAEVQALMDTANTGKIALQMTHMFLNGIAESMIGYTLSKSLGNTLLILRTEGIPIGRKVTELQKTFDEIQLAINSEKDPTKKMTLQEIIKKLEIEKQKLESANVIELDRHRKNPNLNEKRGGTTLPPEIRNDNVIKFIEKVKFSHEIGGYSLAKQEAKTAYCGHINVNGLLDWLWGGKGNIPEFSVLSKKIGLSPKSFIETFNKYSPEGYSMEIKHLSNVDTIKTIEAQIKDGLPVPMIYVPIGGNVKSPHYATIIGIGKKGDGTKVFKIKDSMSDVIPRDYLTEKELMESLAFRNLTSENTTKDVALKTFAAGARLRLGGENTIFLIHKPVDTINRQVDPISKVKVVA